jgi:glycosyltransferase involved in cell wall biosynthesis
MKIFAHTLFKNEEKWLWYSVTSVIDHIDKLLLWDTGSTDRSWEIATFLKAKYPDKILLDKTNSDNFDEESVRQQMLDQTSADWFMVLDADEIWWEGSIRALLSEIHKDDRNVESIVVPTINLVGDIFHRQEERAGRYKLAGRVGHYNLRAINRKIPGLHSQGAHGVWGWVDGDGKMIQDRDAAKIGYIDAPYLHATHLQRAGNGKDSDVIKRKMKLKHEMGIPFPKDFYYPEVFFRDRPEISLNLELFLKRL